MSNLVDFEPMLAHRINPFLGIRNKSLILTLSRLRVQNEFGEVVALGSLCVASPQKQEPLTKTQQQTIIQLAYWVVSDIIQCARARRQRERRRMTDLLSVAQKETDDDAACEEAIFRILRMIYPSASVCLRATKATHLEVEGRDPIDLRDLEHGIWEDHDYIDDFIAQSNHQDLPNTRVVRVIAAPCESMSGHSLLAVASKDFQLVFDDVDLWFVQTCATMVTQLWHRRLLAEVMRAKEKFLRGVSHQLRTPIHGILGSVDLLAEELESRRVMIEAATSALTSTSGGASAYLDIIKTSGRDLISIVNSMITLNRWADIAMTERSYTTRSVRDLEADLAGEIQKAIYGDIWHRASICFHHKLQPDCDSLQMDHTLLRDSLLPLVMNAVQNTPKGMVKVTISLCSNIRELIVDIEDNGCGIHPDDHERIFEPYEKAIDHSVGAGLGLTLASKFASLLNGVVQLISSETGRGSHFRATFQDVESVYSNLKLQPIQATQLSHLPSKFYGMALDDGPLPLCRHFTALLHDRGFVASEHAEGDGFAVVDFVASAEERRKYVSRVPPETLAICLVPASAEDTPLEKTPENIVYVNGPFFTATLDSALLEANKMFAAMEAAKGQIPPNGGMVLNEKASQPITPMGDLVTTPNVSLITEKASQRLQGPKLPMGDTGDATVTAGISSQMAAAPMEPRIVIPVLSTGLSCAKPMTLIVDDNLVNLRIMQMYCRKRGLPFVRATDGSQAVQIFVDYQTLAAATG